MLLSIAHPEVEQLSLGMRQVIPRFSRRFCVLSSYTYAKYWLISEHPTLAYSKHTRQFHIWATDLGMNHHGCHSSYPRLGNNPASPTLTLKEEPRTSSAPAACTPSAAVDPCPTSSRLFCIRCPSGLLHAISKPRPPTPSDRRRRRPVRVAVIASTRLSP